MGICWHQKGRVCLEAKQGLCGVFCLFVCLFSCFLPFTFSIDFVPHLLAVGGCHRIPHFGAPSHWKNLWCSLWLYTVDVSLCLKLRLTEGFPGTCSWHAKGVLSVAYSLVYTPTLSSLCQKGLGSLTPLCSLLWMGSRLENSIYLAGTPNPSLH